MPKILAVVFALPLLGCLFVHPVKTQWPDAVQAESWQWMYRNEEQSGCDYVNGITRDECNLRHPIKL